MNKNRSENEGGRADRELIDVTLVAGDAICQMTSARIESHEDQKLVVTLTEEGFANYLKEIELWRHSDESKEWLEGRDDV